MTGSGGRALPWQALRAIVISVIAVGFSAVAHGVGGATPPPVGALGLLTALSAMVSLPVLLRWRAPAALMPLLAAAQGGLHPAFVALADPSTARHGGLAGAAGGHDGWSPGMVTAHVAAGLLAAALVTLVDDLLRSAFLGRTLRPVLSAPAPAARPAIGRVLARPAWAAVVTALLSAAPRRGPPVVVGS